MCSTPGNAKLCSLNKSDAVAAAAVACVSLLFHLTYFRYGVQNLVDLGVACVDAERILAGQVPGREFFEPYGPGRFYLIALAFKCFGTSLLTLSGLCVALLAVKDALAYLCARQLVRRSWSLYVAGLLIVVHGPIHKVFLTLGCLLFICPALCYIRKPTGLRALGFGLGLFAAGMLRYDLAAYGLVIALFIALLAPRAGYPSAVQRKPLLPGLLLGLAGPGLAYGAYLLAAGADFPAWISHHFVRLNSLEQANSNMPSVLGLLGSGEVQENLFGLLLVFIGIVALGGLILSIRLWMQGPYDARATALILGVLTLSGILLLNQVRLGLKFIRMSQVALPLYIVFAFFLQGIFSPRQRRRSLDKIRWLSPVAAGALFLFLAGYIWAYEGSWSQDSFAVYKLRPHYLDHVRGGCYFRGRKGQEIEEVVRFLEQRTLPGASIFTGPSCPLFHFLADRPNPAPFTDFTFYYFDEENQQRVIDAVEKAEVEYVVRWPRPLTGFIFEECAPRVARYLKTHFAKERTIGRYVILKRRIGSDVKR